MATTAALSAIDDSRSRPKPSRLSSVDILRGIVMVIMALDHTRDFFSNSSAVFDPTDLSKTTAALFFTRWITHFCAPVFVFLAGTGAYLSLGRSKTVETLSTFLVTRGAWLVFLEIFFVSPLAAMFSLSFEITFLQVIWVIGISMILLGGLIRVFSSPTIGVAGVVLILISNLFDGAHVAWLGSAAGIWKVLHQPMVFQPMPNKIVFSGYSLVPWVGVMMAGYAAGEILNLPAALRRQRLFWIGSVATVLFIVIRAINLYGDPARWSAQSKTGFTVLSFLRCSKYPPSLLYLLMTLGPALIVLALLDHADNWLLRHLRVFGRVPLFYYALHFPLLHGLALLMSLMAYGNAEWLLADPIGLKRAFGFKGLPVLTLTNHGFSLPIVYAVWIGTVLLLYPACRWYADLKQRRREAILSYL